MDFCEHLQVLWIALLFHLMCEPVYGYQHSSEVVDNDDMDLDGNLDNFLDGINSISDLLTEFVGDGDGCHFQCKNGM